ncbi:MAG: hypothetical protein LBB68_00625 [Treponema sp.]|jgi:hypothetical protein|nr:hypothetical protein [Treponema sp.]
MADYLSLPDADFDRFFKFMNEYVEGKCTGAQPVWPHIPQAARTAMADACTVWAAAFAKTAGPHTPVDTEAKNDAKEAAKRVIRPFVNQYLRYPPVTDEDRTAMGIPKHDTKPTPVPAPEDVPEVAASTPLPRVLRFNFRRLGAKRWGKPAHVHGMELAWVIADAPPAETEGLLHSSFSTSSPLELTFKESERGKRVYYAARWETGTVKKGNFSEIFSAVVP